MIGDCINVHLRQPGQPAAGLSPTALKLLWATSQRLTEQNKHNPVRNFIETKSDGEGWGMSSEGERMRREGERLTASVDKPLRHLVHLRRHVSCNGWGRKTDRPRLRLLSSTSIYLQNLFTFLCTYNSTRLWNMLAQNSSFELCGQSKVQLDKDCHARIVKEWSAFFSHKHAATKI